MEQRVVPTTDWEWREAAIHFGIKDGIERERLLDEIHRVSECGSMRLTPDQFSQLTADYYLLTFHIQNRNEAIRTGFRDGEEILGEIAEGIEAGRKSP